MAVRFAWLFVASLLAAGEQVRFADPAARDLLQRSRAAIMGQTRTSLQSLVLKGRLRIPRDNADADGLVEIRILLPDRFLRIDTIGSTERRSGFVGRTGLASSDLRRERAQFTRLMLGLTAYIAPEEALTISSTGETAFADTAAVDLGGKGFSARLVFDATSLLPMRIVYFGEGGVSTVVSFANRRDASGFQLPSRITTQTPDRVLETLMFDEILVNPPLGDRDFK